MPISLNVKVMNTNDFQLLQKINDTNCHVKKECSNTLLLFLVQTVEVTATARRKLFKDVPHIDGIFRKNYQKLHVVQRYHKKITP